jgi:hypothetical protein
LPHAEHHTLRGDWPVLKRTRRSAGTALVSKPVGKDCTMLSTLIIVLLVLWLLGVVTSYTLGGFIHILLVIAVVMFLLRIIQGRNPLAD